MLTDEQTEREPNGIPATMRHDAGAYARCHYCGRYSLDPNTLGNDARQPACECGKKHGWSGSFKVPGADAKWSGKAPAALAASQPEGPAPAPVAQTPHLPFAILDDEMAALCRFYETCEDSQPYDVPKDMMKRLAEIGLVRRVTAAIYEFTDFGLSVINGDFAAPPQGPAPVAEGREALTVLRELVFAERAHQCSEPCNRAAFKRRLDAAWDDAYRLVDPPSALVTARAELPDTQQADSSSRVGSDLPPALLQQGERR